MPDNLDSSGVPAKPLDLRFLLTLPICWYVEFVAHDGVSGGLISTALVLLGSFHFQLVYAATLLLVSLFTSRVLNDATPGLESWPLLFLRFMALNALLWCPGATGQRHPAMMLKRLLKKHLRFVRLAVLLTFLVGCTSIVFLRLVSTEWYVVATIASGLVWLRLMIAKPLHAASSLSIRAMLIVPVISLALFTVLAEASIRFLKIPSPQYVSGEFFQPYPEAFHVLRPSSSTPTYLTEEETNEPIVLRINQRGIRDRSFDVKAKGVFRIVCLGDSFTMGMGAPEHLTFPKQLERELAKTFAGKQFEVVNLGCPGHGPFQHQIMLEDFGMAYEPDMVIQQLYSGNDLIDELARNRRLPEACMRSYFQFRVAQLEFEPWHWEYELAKKIRLVDFIGSGFRTWRRTYVKRSWLPSAELWKEPRYDRPSWAEPLLLEVPPRIAEAWQLIEESIVDTQTFCRERNLDYLVIQLSDFFEHFPVPDAAWANPHRIKDPSRYDLGLAHRMFEAMLTKHAIEHICFSPIFESEIRSNQARPYNDYERHLSPNGHEIVSKNISGYLREHQGNRLAFHLSEF